MKYRGRHGQHPQHGTRDKKGQQQQNEWRFRGRTPEKVKDDFIGIFQREAKEHQKQAYGKQPEYYLHERRQISRKIRKHILRQKKWHPAGCHSNK
jgi:hypothetical protein